VFLPQSENPSGPTGTIVVFIHAYGIAWQVCRDKVAADTLFYGESACWAKVDGKNALSLIS
jgi:hypothetical protein